MKGPIRVLVADDHPLMLSGLCSEINAEKDMQVIATAATGQEALLKFQELHPDLVLIDLRMPGMGGMELISAIHSRSPDTGIIVFTTSAGDIHARRALAFGAKAYLLKHMLRRELVTTIRLVAAGRRYVPQQVSMLMARYEPTEQISARETQILTKVATGMSNKEIADSLAISEFTVKGYLKNILQKLGAKDRTHAVTIALQRGFLDL